ncbi:pilus assembly FimT family protein [Geomonas anaerohicana]|uniref:Prepilin-type N-terminal cleavage/methylation domain-containing protein n=1 Tax=Geomonas anaerohicana TaxID=2798583 RepID=A0ABS0YCH9_9BACT|nr:prepilin-type N-terminal cleavage/methylation domain-containing protein [Geomonas anaerohicana]MBJ6749614.1 prepilin-type N-terminal cleavage/methylation domain-containing protein [Geomonas anaerohicana]
MGSRGFSLIEMILAIGLAAILTAIGSFYFQKYQKSYRIDAQTRLLFTELLKARTLAIYQRRGTRVKIYADRFEVYSSLQDGGAVHPVQRHLLQYPVTATANLDLAAGGNIDFDETGITYGWSSICLESVPGYGAVDSVVVAATRVSIGKKGTGDDCKTENIKLK